MECLHMNYLRDLIHRVRSGESDRRIARDLGISRTTVRKYREWAKAQGYLESGTPMPDGTTLATALGTAPQPPRVALQADEPSAFHIWGNVQSQPHTGTACSRFHYPTRGEKPGFLSSKPSKSSLFEHFEASKMP